MDFFSSQDRARRRTLWLVAAFAVAVVFVVVAVWAAAGVAVAIAAGWEGASSGRSATAGLGLVTSLPFFLGVAAVTLSIISGGTLYKISSLSGGGDSVARLLGGRPVDPNSPDLAERRLLNVVEEMALASGIPVPDVFLMEKEKGINAFAAGLGTGDAVVAVTRGTLDHLDRDELQGVVAHEFSHILNGDMRLNVRLIGLVHGILVVALVGWWMTRMTMHGGRGRGRFAVAVLGLVVVAVGWVGVLFGRIIKGAISREREFLADAAAVQFTRNPLGIAGALKKIGGLGAGSKLASRHAEEASHLYFASGVGAAWFRWTSSHPPLEERIRRLDPTFDGRFEPPRREAEPRHGPPPSPAEGDATPLEVLAGDDEQAALALPVLELLATVGNPDASHLAHAAAQLGSWPPELVAAAREPATAGALVAALLLDADREVRRNQLEGLSRPAFRAQVEVVAARWGELPTTSRLPLVDLALPALRRHSETQYRALRADLESLAKADGRISLFEYTLERILLRHLDPHFLGGGAPAPSGGPLYAADLAPGYALALSALAHAGHDDPTAVERAYGLATRELRLEAPVPPLLSREACSFTALDEALALLAGAPPRRRERLLAAAGACVAADGRITVAEAELLRAIADAVDCPVPPVVVDDGEGAGGGSRQGFPGAA